MTTPRRLPITEVQALMREARSSSKRGATPLEVSARFVELVAGAAYEQGLADGRASAGADPDALVAALGSMPVERAVRADLPLEPLGAPAKRRKRNAIPPRNAEGEFEIPDDPDELDAFLSAKDES